MKVYKVVEWDNKVSENTIEYEKETEHFFINKNGRDKKVSSFSCMSTDKKVCEEWLLDRMNCNIDEIKRSIESSTKKLKKKIEEMEAYKTSINK